MTPPADDSERPGVYARLAEEAEIRKVVHTPPRWVRWFGWGVCVALAAGVGAAALAANPW